MKRIYGLIKKDNKDDLGNFEKSIHFGVSPLKLYNFRVKQFSIRITDNLKVTSCVTQVM